MVGDRLLALRRDADLTQDELAGILRINKHSISAYERGKSEPPDEIKMAIARYFSVSVDYLLGMTDDPTPVGSQAGLLRLPEGFPRSEVPALLDYAAFLIHRSTKK